jgi:hypothetical protein
MMNTAQLLDVIETTDHRGLGIEASPLRIVTQYWGKDGTLLAERDPSPDYERTIQMLRDAVAALGGLDALAKQCPELAGNLRLNNTAFPRRGKQ